MLNTIRERFKHFSRRKFTPDDLNQIQIDLLEESTLDTNYIVLILGSCIIATVVSLGLSQANWSLSLGATLLYLTNLLGITLACMLTFLIAGFTPLYSARKAISWTLALTAILVIPLGVSFAELIRQAQLEASLKKSEVKRLIIPELKRTLNYFIGNYMIIKTMFSKAVTNKNVIKFCFVNLLQSC